MIRFFQFFIVNYKVSVTLTLFLVIYGVMGFSRINRETNPPVNFAIATITTIYPGSSPQEVEEKITKKIEDQVRTVDGIKDVKSVSKSGRSDIVVRVDMDNVDTDKVMSDLQRAIQRVKDLPPDILDDPLISEVKASELPVIDLAIVGTNEGRKRDRFAEDLKSLLENISGVSEVVTSGFTKREYQILLDTEKLKVFKVGIAEVQEAVRRHIQEIPAGYIRSDTVQNLVRIEAKVKSADELGDIVVRSNFTGQSIRVRDVAEVKDGSEEPSVLTRLNGNSATLLSVIKKSSADSVDLVERLNVKLDDLKKNFPDGLGVKIYNNEGERIGDQLSVVINNAMVGMLLVLIITLLFLPGVVGLVTSLSLPLAVLGTAGFMPALGVNFNKITMLAFVIAIGMLVDNSVVISENYARLRKLGNDNIDAAILAVKQVWLPVTATVLTTIAAFLPMLVTKGVMGQFIRLIPIIVTLALLMSLVESFILLPARLRFTVRGKKSEQPGRFEKLMEKFEGFILACVRRRYLIFFGMGGLLIGSVVLAMFGNRFELFPNESVEFYFGRFEAKSGTPIARTEKLASDLEEKVLALFDKKELKHLVTRVGVSRIGLSDPRERNGDHVGMIQLVVPREIADKQNPQEILSRIRSIKDHGFEELVFESGRHGPPVGQALQVAFRSNDYDAIQELSKGLILHLKDVDGVMDLVMDEIKGDEEYLVELDYTMLAKLKLDTQTVGLALRTALQGAIVTELNEDNTEFNVRVRYLDRDRKNVEALRDTKIMDRMGNLIPLGRVAKLKKVEGPSNRKHFNYLRSITVSAGIVPEKISAVKLNAMAREYVDEQMKNHPGVATVFGGEEESTKESMQSLLSAMVIALFGILTILIFLFRSFSKPLLVLSTIPLGLIGVNTSFFLHNKPLSFLAMIGVVGLAGVVVNSAIVLMSFIEDYRSEMSQSIEHVVAKASSQRFRAVMVTTLTTLGGLFPTAYGIGGSDPILVPMTLALAWGLMSGTFLTLVWIPCGYVIIEDITKFSSRFFGKGLEEDSAGITSQGAGAN